MADLFWLAELQIRRNAPYSRSRTGGPRVDDHRVTSGILHIVGDGAHWRDAAADYEPHKTLYIACSQATNSA